MTQVLKKSPIAQCFALSLLVFAGAAQAQQVLADAPVGDPALTNEVLDQRIPAVPNDIIFGQLAGGFDDRPQAPANDAEAAKFLTQATFGPTMTEINELKSIGYAAWIDRQLSLDATLQRPELEQQVATDVATTASVGTGGHVAFRQERWFATAAKSSDQLRQRMAFALSQILVMSDVGTFNNQPVAVAEYNDILLRNAFGSYRTLLTDVTYSPMMGRYLTSFRNSKTDWTIPSQVVGGPLVAGLVAPDENYAREIMQLFSIGLVERNLNFTPIALAPPTYTQEIISQTAKAFTGLAYRCSAPVTYGAITLSHNCANCVGDACNFSATAFNSSPQRYGIPNGGGQIITTALYHPDTYRPMACYPRYADTGRSQELLNNFAVLPAPFDRKVIIAGVTINASPVACHANTPVADRAACINYCTGQIDTVVNTLSLHPNVAPFLSRQLIQRFTTSNPSSEYIGRVAAVFVNDGSNVRGNLGAVLKAILLDPEARSATPAQEFGKLREPLLRLTAIWRAFDVSPNAAGTFGVVFPERAFAQRAFGAQSVFNFYEPDFQQAGEIANAGLVSPEFQILDESTAISASDQLYTRIFNGYNVASAASTPFTTPGSSYLPPAVIDALPTANAELLEALNIRLLAGQMSASMKTKVLALMNGAMAATDHRRRALSMIHLIAISPEFVIQR